MKKVLVVILLLTALSLQQVNAAETATEKLKRIQKTMYTVLRTMALPDGTEAEKKGVTQRFVLQVPGKQLNPMDYDPTNYTQDITFNRLSSFIPPVIEENMFRLTDIVPVANPMKGGETGESFSDMYEAVLNQLDVRSFQKKSKERQDMYKDAINYLAKPIPDPDDLTRNTTRLGMYAKLQKKYNDIRLDMEDKIKAVKDEHEDDPVKYQTWFQTHYPAMYANVENAYTEWLVFGEKDLVELYKAHLDVESQGVAVEEARMALRSSGKISLDRSSTVYPVHFEPPNWYEYLRAKPQSLSREQIQMKISDLEARIAVLQTMKSGSKGGPNDEEVESEEGEEPQNNDGDVSKSKAEKDLTEANKKKEEAKKELEEQAKTINYKKIACKVFKHPAACGPFNEAQSKMAELKNKYAQEKTKANYAEFLLGANDESDKSINGLIAKLEVEKKRYISLFESAQTTEPEIIKSATTEGDRQDFNAGWMSFEYDSSERTKTEDKSSESYDASLSFSASGWGWGVSGGFSYSQEEHDFAQKLSQADLKVSAKVLKVHIKRPWFKSSVFKFNDIMTRSDQKVSPGPMAEADLIKSLEGNTNSYLLPQFVNGFLLAKDIKLDFQGVDHSVTSHAFQRSISAHLSGHYGPFSASASFNYGTSDSQLRVESSAGGLRISIPGAQLIGYYVTVLPCFPKNTCDTDVA